jgi:DNA invertase Pin-like site-specific DNA recombinase
MQKHKEIIRLAEGGEKQREISRIVHCSLRTVGDTLKAGKRLGIGYNSNSQKCIARPIAACPSA